MNYDEVISSLLRFPSNTSLRNSVVGSVGGRGSHLICQAMYLDANQTTEVSLRGTSKKVVSPYTFDS